MQPRTTIYPTRDLLMAGAADGLVAAAGQAIAERGRWRWVLAGGSTPEAVYRLLAQAPRREQIDWARVQVWWGDERCVPPDDHDSNFGMARRALLDHVAIPASNIHRMRGELPPAEAAQEYIAQMRAAFGNDGTWPSFDTILLGIGNDGHTASLFPASDILGRSDVAVAATWVAKLNAHRISLTYPTINAARDTIFLVAGADKAPIVQAILGGTGNEYPAAQVANARWLLDAAAGESRKP